MPARAYHPLSIRSIFPGHSHLADLEAQATARSSHSPDPADVEAYVREVGRLLQARADERRERSDPALLDRTTRDEALRTSRALQWARSGNRIVRVPAGGPPGKPAFGTMRIGGIQLPSTCVYVAFSDDFATPDPALRIAGAYLGEGGSPEALAAGWAEYVWALVIAHPRSGDNLGSAAASWHASFKTDVPGRTISDALDDSFASDVGIFPAPFIDLCAKPSEDWRRALAEAIECSLQAAAQASVATVVPRVRLIPDEDDIDDASAPAVPLPEPETSDVQLEEVRIAAKSSAPPRGIADVMFGTSSPRARNRWLVERSPLPAGSGSAQRRRGGKPRREPEPHYRAGYLRTYHGGTKRQFTGWVRAHPVKGGKAKASAETVIVDRLDPQRAPSP